jgi:crooked neck
LKEYERARAIYKYALDRLPRSKAAILHKAYTRFEKQYGDSEGVEDVILSKRRVQYEEQVKASPRNYDSWIAYCAMEETSGDEARVRDVYERAIAQLPPTQEKRHWRRYIFIWLYYAIWAEIGARDADRARQIYTECLKLIPHKKFTFGKVWLLYAQFLVRQGDLSAARKTLGQAIGMCPKDKLFKGYIALELKLFEFERCRTLYEKQISFSPSNSSAWIKFAELERGLDDTDRARAIFELAVAQPELDMPELLWKAYIDFEEEEAEFDRTRGLYERLLQKTDHVKVWISFAHFELNVPDADAEADAGDASEEDEELPVSQAAISRARALFQRAYARLKELGHKEERVALLQAWRAFEAEHGGDKERKDVLDMMPQRVKKRRKLDDDSFEEYLDYVFPKDNEGAAKLGKLMEMAQMWKKTQAADDGGGGAGTTAGEADGSGSAGGMLAGFVAAAKEQDDA